MKTSHELGTIFKSFRTSRRIGMRAAAHGLTPATISRFENGTTDLNSQAAMQLMTNIGMGVADLEDRLDHHFPSPFSHLIHLDRESIKTEVSIYLSQHANTRLTTILSKVLPLLTKPFDANDQVPFQDEQVIADLLAYPLLWHNYEATILIAVWPFASHEFHRLIWQRVDVQIHHNLNWQQHLIAFLGMLSLTQQDPEMMVRIKAIVNYFLASSKRAIRPVQARPLLVALDKMIADQSVSELVKALEVLKIPSYSKFIQAIWQTAQQAKPSWHNVNLRDHHDPNLEISPSDTILSGSTLAKIRKQRGLTLKDVTVNWALSTQSRFEKSQTLLSFTHTLELLDQLMLPLSIVAIGQDTVGNFENAFNQIWAMGENTDRYALADFEHIVDDYCQQHDDLPTVLKTMQTYALSNAVISACAFKYDLEEPLLSRDTQDLVISYFESLDQVSQLDAQLLRLILNGLDADHVDLIKTVCAKINPRSTADVICRLNMAQFLYASVYAQNADLLEFVTNYFQQNPDYDHQWRIARNLEFGRLLLAAYNHDKTLTANSIAQYLWALKLTANLPDQPYDQKHWLQFAIDRNYSSLAH